MYVRAVAFRPISFSYALAIRLESFIVLSGELLNLCFLVNVLSIDLVLH